MRDLIERRAAIDAFMKATSDGDKVDFCIGVIKSVPSAHPRKGKWAGKGDSEGFGIFICDNCGKFAMMEYDFCPNCGCRMEEGDSE